MSRKSARYPPPKSRTPWIITALAAATLVVVLATGQAGSRRHVHPEPRPNGVDLALAVMPASFFAGDARQYRDYTIAREIPGVLDGVYCYCFCLESMGHRSLLQCFQSQHAAGCDVCLAQAELADQMQREGRNLLEIQAAMDVRLGRT
jgi:hypothetical protein